MTVMIALVGEQPQPNFLPVLQYEPSDAVFVYTSRTYLQYMHLKTELQKKEYSMETASASLRNRN